MTPDPENYGVLVVLYYLVETLEMEFEEAVVQIKSRRFTNNLNKL